MATKLTKAVSRETTAKVFDSGQHRPVIVTLNPPCHLEFHLKGTRRKVSFDAQTLYYLGVREQMNGNGK